MIQNLICHYIQFRGKRQLHFVTDLWIFYVIVSEPLRNERRRAPEALFCNDLLPAATPNLWAIVGLHNPNILKKPGDPNEIMLVIYDKMHYNWLQLGHDAGFLP